MNINLLELWSEMGIPVKVVVIVLTLQAVASIAVAIDRLILLARSTMASRAFAKKAAPLVDRGDWAGLFDAAASAKGSHLALLIFTGTKVFLDRDRAGDSAERAAELARRAIERKGESVSDELNRGLNVLASTGSTAPFVGLLGTVLGILNAFQMIAASGSGGIGTIGASIGEALIVTGYGLAVAIPTVLVFNWITGRISRFEMGLTNAGSELADRLECSDAPSAPATRERDEVATGSEELQAVSA
ncbi:MAG: MotA/TolQ/ExbB proton channel family protein [Myxococcota bacterium]|nr:MotA/TolQ/ExbB proton channel family protein [Myxococcota bacterium]